ncbi:poly [ADP-ribose] polymerase 14-like isoform X2 [Pomacea canaliculata]|uniref:poly [ADP-ribose] polymerase 14-like isoform X2 n=1 Tax=Pomacea canaliculata TaxID=400727 RepID=UPI000D73D98C|nr:poly [ADP-ribose] polymerase 14-like isoform X2 [Pomacea canaliculata]
MRPFRRIFRYFHGYWSQGTPQDEEEPQEDEIFYDVPENALENQSDGETQQLREWEQELQSQEWLSCLDTGPFYSDKLFLKNVAPVVTKELLVNYMETVTGQNDIEPRYCDEPGDVLLTFKAEIDFEKVKNKCQTKLLKERQLEVWRVPVSNSILVENLSPDTDPDHVSCYFETPRANGGTVLKVQPVQDKQKCVVCFKDAKVVDDVLKVTHILGGRELRVSLYLKCLGPSGGKAEPNVFKPPATVTLTDKDNVKVRFLSHSAETLEFFNFILEDVHAQASVVGNVLMVSYKIKESTDRLDILMENWREKVNKQLEICFDYIGLESITVPQEIWYETWKAIKKSIFDHDDLVLPDEDEFTFVVLSKPAAGGNTGGNTFQQVQRIAKVKERKFKLQSREKTDTKKLKKFQLELLMLSTFLSDTQSQGMKIKVDIRLQEGEVNFRGSQMAIREAEVKMYDILQSASSRVVTDVPHVHVALLATDEARDAVNNRLRQAGLAATWECCGNGIIFYCLHQTALLQAVNLIKTSFKTECISLDEVSSSLQTTAEWKDTVQKLVRKHCGLVSINTHHRTISLTAFCDLMPTVKENIGKFVSESSIYSTAFQLSPSRLKFVTLFWEEKLSSIAEKLKQYKIKITLQSDSVLARGTKQGIELVRKELTFLSEQIVSTKELITRKETIRCLSTPRTKNELEAIACTCKCVLSLHPENVSVEMISTNLSAEGPRVHAVQGDITHLNVDVIVNAANELMDHAGGLAGHIVLKGGDEIQKECYRILKDKGKLSEGDVLVSGPGKLPCKAIIHAVGPRYKGGNTGEEKCLRNTVKHTSIAIPAISSGIFGYPVKEATRVIVQAVKLFFETNRDSSITDVQLTDILTDTVQEFQKALEAPISNYTPITKQAPFVLQGLSGQENSATTATVLAMEEDITQLAVDVIVNAANERMSHDGGLAGYIVKKGGDKIQEECFRILKTRGKLSEGDVLVSGPGKLPCKRIIHAVGPVYRGGNKGEEECLRDTVMECLKTASDKGYFSIAIPAISSGIFGYPVEEATRVIVQAVRIFLDANHDSSIQVVLLCDILPKTVADFEKALKATARKGERSAGSLPGSSQTTEFLFSGKELAFSQAAGLNKPRGHQHITTSVNIVDDTMNRSTPGAVQNVNKGMVATTAPISNPRVPGFDFGGIHVTIKQGDITTEEVDAIVNSSNSQLDLSRGAVSCQLRTKCGPALESACKAKLSEIAQRKVVTTAAFNLRCKHIVHIDTYHYVNNDRLTTAYLDILTEADNLGLNSIALPAIGTGNLNISPSKSARAMGKALVAHARIRKTVRTVTVVLFEANMTRDFTVNLTARAAEQGFAPSTTSGKSDGFKRLYLPENGDGEWTTRPQNSPLPKVLKLYIFAASQDKRADFLKALDSLVNSKFVEQEIKDFDKLSRDKLEELCGKYNLELLQRDGGASVKGMADDIQMMKEEISSMAKKAERQQQENLIANLVQWYFFEVTTTGIKRIPYQKGPNLLIENAFQNSQDTVELTDSEGTVYVVSFKDMTDSVKMCPTDSVQIMRKEIITDTANSASLLPETWEPLSSDESVKRVPLVKGCPEYQSVKASISQTAKGGFKIELIERIQNPELYKQYVAKKTQMNKQNNGIQSEKTLWHGTSSDAIDNINLYGFNRSFCGKNATVYGQGVYFAVNSSYSMSDTYSVRDQSGRKHLYQCRVLVGYPTVGNSDMKFLPTRQGKIRYDSATDRNSSPKMYIIFNDTQAYPEYLITFK